MAGTDTSRGMNFQYSCGISFILDFLQQSHWKVLQFEGDEDIEDIVVFGDKEDVIRRIQVKQKGSPYQWIPSDLKDVLLRFSQCHDSEKTIYQFIYIGSEGAVFANKLYPIFRKIEFEDSSSLNVLEEKLLGEHLGKDVLDFICKVGQRLKITKWGSKNHLETENLLRIRKLFKPHSFSNLESDYEKIIKSILFDFVAQRTDPKSKYFRRVEREQVLKVLQNSGYSIEAYQHNRNNNVPFPPLTKPAYSLVGRRDILQNLKRRLFIENMYYNIALSGLPGVGKTALAIELAHDPDVHFHFFDGILWAGPGLHPDILTILGEWAATVGIPREEIALFNSIEARAKAIRTIIGELRMLIIIDDVWQIETALALKVGGPNCAHLVTTRLPVISQQFASIDNAISVQELNEGEGVQLFEQLIPNFVNNEPDEARKLIQVVGGLPLALILLSKYLLRHSSQPRRLHAALEQLRTVQERLRVSQPQMPLERHPDLPLDIPLSLQAVIQISVDELNETSKQALYALAVFPPKPNTFSDAAAIAVSAAPISVLDDLYDYGLLEIGGLDRYMLHQTIVDYALLNCNNEDLFYRRMAIFFVELIKRHESEKKYEIEYENLDIEINNIFTAIRSVFERNIDDVLVRIVNTSYRFMEKRGLYYFLENYLLQSERIARYSGDIFEQEFALYHLGRISNKLGQHEKAIEYLSDGLTLASQRDDIDQVANILGNISEACLELRDETWAEQYALKSLAISNEFDLVRNEVAALVILGSIYIRRNNYDRAERYYLEALKKAKSLASYGEMSPLLANLGLIVSKQENCVPSEAYLQEALSIALRERNYEHIIYARINILNIIHEQGKDEEAESQLREVLKIAHSVKNHKIVRSVISSILKITHDYSDFIQGKEYLQKGIILNKEFAFEDLQIFLLMQLGVFSGKLNEHMQARESFQEALEFACKTEQNEQIFNLLINLGKTAIHLEDYAESEQYFKRALAQASKSTDGEKMTYILRLLSKLEAIYRKDYGEAKKYAEIGLDLAYKQNDSKIIFNFLGELYEIEHNQQNYENASTHVKEALVLARKEDDKKKIYDLLMCLYDVAKHQQDYKTAEISLKEAYPLILKQDSLEASIALLVNLAEIVGCQEDYEGVEMYLKEALALAQKQNSEEKVYSLQISLSILEKNKKTYQRAEEYAQQALSLARKMANGELISQALNLLSAVYFDQQSFDLIQPLASEALVFAQKEKNQSLIGTSLYNLGIAAEKQGNFIEARRLGQESLSTLDTIEGFPGDFIRKWLATLPDA